MTPIRVQDICIQALAEHLPDALRSRLYENEKLHDAICDYAQLSGKYVAKGVDWIEGERTLSLITSMEPIDNKIHQVALHICGRWEESDCAELSQRRDTLVFASKALVSHEIVACSDASAPLTTIDPRCKEACDQVIQLISNFPLPLRRLKREILPLQTHLPEPLWNWLRRIREGWVLQAPFVFKEPNRLEATLSLDEEKSLSCTLLLKDREDVGAVEIVYCHTTAGKSEKFVFCDKRLMDHKVLQDQGGFILTIPPDTAADTDRALFHLHRALARPKKPSTETDDDGAHYVPYLALRFIPWQLR